MEALSSVQMINKNDDKKSIKQRRRRSRLSQSEVSNVNIKISSNTYTDLKNLADEANGSGPRRVQVRDLVELAVKKINKSEVENLRKEKATTQDRFNALLEDFKQKNPDANADDLLEKLMKKAGVSEDLKAII